MAYDNTNNSPNHRCVKSVQIWCFLWFLFSCIIGKLIKCSPEKLVAVFTLTVFEILLFEGRLALWSARRVPMKELNFHWKDKKSVPLLLELLRRFWVVFRLFWFCLSLSVLEKLKSSIFEILINPQTLNINNSSTTSAKSINVDIVRKLIEYSSKNTPSKAMLTWALFEILLWSQIVIMTRTTGSRE